MAKWIVTGVDKKRNKLVLISDSVQGTDDSSEAMEKARKKYPRAPELSVTIKAKS